MNLWDEIWKDKRGHVVIWQTPNPYLIAWAVLTLISLFFNGHTADIFSGAADVALIVWASLELFKGVNYFRRALGLVVLVAAIMSLIKIF
ncbi:MAG TPA: hypothetical protein VH234_04710 [Candidatus Saccharimonadales bacterium]|jgi:hypothetical protein|nr:hypothetical protein [Candidatus Saccharimonadales bacterium]